MPAAMAMASASRSAAGLTATAPTAPDQSAGPSSRCGAGRDRPRSGRRAAARTARHTLKPCRIACSHSPVVHCLTSRWEVMSLIVRRSWKSRAADTLEHVMAAGIVEGERRHALFDHRSAAAVLDLVEQRSALAFSAEQGARDRRPAQHGGISEMENVVEAVAVRIIGVVSQLRAEWLAVDQRRARAGDLRPSTSMQFDLEPARKALAFRKRRVEGTAARCARSPSAL